MAVRYNLVEFWNHGQWDYIMHPKATGQYVKNEDYAALAEAAKAFYLDAMDNVGCLFIDEALMNDLATLLREADDANR